jgi:thymidylate synthase (FAD)
VRVTLLAATAFLVPDHVPWQPDSRDDQWLTSGSDLVEFAGRACYQSWTRPNPATATNEGYLNHILEVGHFSVLEHASATFYVEGVSRSLTHELVRHRHFAYSQLSQRYVKLGNDAEGISPPELEGNSDAFAVLDELLDHVQLSYDRLVEIMENQLSDVDDRTERRKRARQAARAVLPNMTETKIVVTGNYRAWLHFIKMRAAQAADHEIRRLAVELLGQLQEVAPAVFNHFQVVTLDDGTKAAEWRGAGQLEEV